MSMSHAPTNPKTLLQQNILLSDDAEVLKNSSVVSSPVQFSAEVKSLRDDFAKLTTRLNEIIQTAVENHTVKMFEEYGVVSDFDGKRITTK